VEGLFGIVSQVSNFSEALQEFISLVEQVETLVPVEIRSVIRQIDLLSQNGCTNPSSTFASYTFDLLVAEDLLTEAEADLSTYQPCDHIAKIQKAFDYTTSVSVEDVDLKSLVVIPDDLKTSIANIFGSELDIQSILDLFQTKSLRRLLNFVSEFLTPSDLNAASKLSGRRRLLSQASSIPLSVPFSEMSPHQKRLDLIRDVRGTGDTLVQRHRRRSLEETSIITIPVGDYLSIGFSFNFGDGNKEILLTAAFDFKADER
jgi:hypothetical protein